MTRLLTGALVSLAVGILAVCGQVAPSAGTAPSAADWAGASAPATGSAPAVEGVFFHEGFDDADLAKRGWYDTGAVRIVGGAAGGAGCVEFEWDAAGKALGSRGARRLFEPSEEVYVRFYLRLSEGFGWTGRGYHPHLTHVLTTENARFVGPAATHLTLYIEPVDGKLRLGTQDIENKDAPHGLTQGPLRGGYNGIARDSREVLFRDGRWHCIEAYFRLNTLDAAKDRPNADGIVRGWFDGRLVIDHTDAVLRSTDFPKMRFNQFLMAPYFGPGLLPQAQKLWIDELVVGRRRGEPPGGRQAASQPSPAAQAPAAGPVSRSAP